MGDFDLKSTITTYINLESAVTRSFNLESRIDADFYGELQETTLPFEVVQGTPEQLPNTKLKPPSSVR